MHIQIIVIILLKSLGPLSFQAVLKIVIYLN